MNTKKAEAFDSVYTSLGLVRQQLLNHLLYEQPVTGEYEPLLRQLGEVVLIQEEARAHREALKHVGQICAHGLAGTKPDRWDEVMKGEIYDPYRELREALEMMPARTLSSELVAYIGQLPDQAKQGFLDMVANARGDKPIWPGSPFEKLSDDEAKAGSDEAREAKAKAMSFIQCYADEVAQAWQLIETRGGFARIRELLA